MTKPLLCRLLRHRWRYHGIPEERRVCIACGLREWFVAGEWVNERP